MKTVKEWLAEMPQECMNWWLDAGCDGSGAIVIGGDDAQGYTIDCRGCEKCQRTSDDRESSAIGRIAKALAAAEHGADRGTLVAILRDADDPAEQRTETARSREPKVGDIVYVRGRVKGVIPSYEDIEHEEERALVEFREGILNGVKPVGYFSPKDLQHAPPMTEPVRPTDQHPLHDALPDPAQYPDPFVAMAVLAMGRANTRALAQERVSLAARFRAIFEQRRERTTTHSHSEASQRSLVEVALAVVGNSRQCNERDAEVQRDLIDELRIVANTSLEQQDQRDQRELWRKYQDACWECGSTAHLEVPGKETPVLIKLREAVMEAREVLLLCRSREFAAPEDAEVKIIGSRLGFGALMDAASKLWRDKLAEDGWPEGGEFTVGPCRSTVIDTLRLLDEVLELDRARATLQQRG